MAYYVLLSFEDDEAAKTLVEDMILGPQYAPALEGGKAEVKAVFRKPTKFCDPSDGHRGSGKFTFAATRGRKYGWWVCSKCGKPSKEWAKGDRWYTALGTNLLPVEVIQGEPDTRPRGWEKGVAMWDFLLPEGKELPPK